MEILELLTGDRLRASVVLLTSLAMVGSNTVLATCFRTIVTPQQASVMDATTGSFAGWRVILLLALVYAVYQALPRNLGQPLFFWIGWGTALAFLWAGLWPLAVVTGHDAVANLLLMLLWGTLAVVYRQIARAHPPTVQGHWLVVSCLAPFFGWVTAALPVHLASLLHHAGVDIPGGRGEVGLLVVTACIATWFVREGQGGPWPLWGTYALTVVWVLVAQGAHLSALPSLSGLGALLATVLVRVA